MKKNSRLPIDPGVIFACLISGLALAGAFPLTGWWYLAPVGLIPLIISLIGLDSRQSFMAGYLTGLIRNGILYYWIYTVLVEYGHLHPILAIPIFLLLLLYLSLYMGAFTYGLTLIRKRCGWRFGSLSWLLTGAALYCGLEYAKGFILTGFPWEPLGGALLPALPLVQLSDIVGAQGLTYLVVLVNLCGASIWFRAKHGYKQVALPLIIVLVIGISLWGYGRYRLNDIENKIDQAPGHQVAVAQGAIDQEIKWDPDQRVFTLITYRDLTFQAAARRPWLIVWPETAAPVFFLKDMPATTWLEGLAREAGAALLFGAPAYEVENGEEHYFNRAYLLNADGQLNGFYDKVHLVPFGEYVPLKKYLPFLEKISEAAGNYQAGPLAKTLELDGEKLGVLICYESVFPELALSQVRAGAGYLIVITNDAWFGRSSAPKQHYDQAALRAIETRRTVIRAANTGISGIILPTGRTTVGLGLFERDTLLGKAPRLEEKTIYAVTGNLVGRVSLGWTIIVFAAAFIRRKRHAD